MSVAHLSCSISSATKQRPNSGASARPDLRIDGRARSSSVSSGFRLCGANCQLPALPSLGAHFEIGKAGVLTHAAILGTLAWAWHTDNRGALWVAYAMFSLEIFALYIKKIGTLLGTSVFFLMAGLMVAALAAVAYRLHSGTRARARTTP